MSCYVHVFVMSLGAEMARIGRILRGFFESESPPAGPGRDLFEQGKARLLSRKITTLSHIIDHYYKLAEEERFCIMRFLNYLKVQGFGGAIEEVYSDLWAIMQREITGPSSLLRGVTSSAIAAIAREPEIMVLSELLRKHKHDSISIPLIQSIVMNDIFIKSHNKKNIILILSDILSDKSAFDESRSTAAEGLYRVLQGIGRRSNTYKSSVDLLICGLQDESPLVRYTCIFSLGALAESKALRKLAEIALTDHAVCPGMPEGEGRISEEALRAIYHIATRRGQIS